MKEWLLAGLSCYLPLQSICSVVTGVLQDVHFRYLQEAIRYERLLTIYETVYDSLTGTKLSHILKE